MGRGGRLRGCSCCELVLPLMRGLHSGGVPGPAGSPGCAALSCCAARPLRPCWLRRRAFLAAQASPHPCTPCLCLLLPADRRCDKAGRVRVRGGAAAALTPGWWSPPSQCYLSSTTLSTPAVKETQQGGSCCGEAMKHKTGTMQSSVTRCFPSRRARACALATAQHFTMPQLNDISRGTGNTHSTPPCCTHGQDA